MIMKIRRHIRDDVKKGMFMQTIINVFVETLTPFFENYSKRRMHTCAIAHEP